LAREDRLLAIITLVGELSVATSALPVHIA
jgi:hypothetical protein